MTGVDHAANALDLRIVELLNQRNFPDSRMRVAGTWAHLREWQTDMNKFKTSTVDLI